MRPRFPSELAELHWHRDPRSRRYRSLKSARGACRWLNNNDGAHDHWLYRPGPADQDGAIRLERRYVGGDLTWWAALQPVRLPDWRP